MPKDKKTNEGLFYKLDKLGYEFIKNNDPTGFIQYFYEETSMGKLDKEITKKVDKGIDQIVSNIGEGVTQLDEIFKSLAREILHTTKSDNNRNLPKIQIENQNHRK